MALKRFIPVMVLAASCTCFAQSAPQGSTKRTVPTVIYDGGGIAIGGLLSGVTPADSSAQPRPPIRQQVYAGLSSIEVFPVRSTKAGPGRLPAPTRAKLQGGPGQPICVIGDDALSQEWLQINLAVLKRIGASCIVASVRSAADFTRLKFLAGDLLLMPAPFDDLSNVTGITVWPVLIGADGMVSQ